jgi:plasmid maintenance system antidote protein VapI
MARLKTDGDLLLELEKAVERYTSDAQAARSFGVSRSHLSRVLSGQKPITAKIAHGLGYEQQKRYVRYEHRDYAKGTAR